MTPLLAATILTLAITPSTHHATLNPPTPGATMPSQSNISYPYRHPNQPTDPGTRRRIGQDASNPTLGITRSSSGYPVPHANQHSIPHTMPTTPTEHTTRPRLR